MALNDRFHQLRGDKFREIANLSPGAESAGAEAQMSNVRGNVAQKTVMDMLNARGIPPTQQNMQAGLQYMLGGQLKGVDMQGDTASQIADASMQGQNVAPGGGGGGGGAPASAPPGGMLSSPRPMPNSGQQPDALPMQGPPVAPDGGDDSNRGGSGGILGPAAVGAAAAALMFAKKRQQAVQNDPNATPQQRYEAAAEVKTAQDASDAEAAREAGQVDVPTRDEANAVTQSAVDEPNVRKLSPELAGPVNGPAIDPASQAIDTDDIVNPKQAPERMQIDTSQLPRGAQVLPQHVQPKGGDVPLRQADSVDAVPIYKAADGSVYANLADGQSVVIPVDSGDGGAYSGRTAAQLDAANALRNVIKPVMHAVK